LLKGILISISRLAVYVLSSLLPWSSLSNVPEQAFNPFTGNGKNTNDWKNLRGINSQNIFYGLRLTGIGYRTDSAGNFEYLEAKLDGLTFPRI